jgi:AraC-like DNA-binding protein
MPIFMDRHDVSDKVTAEILADLHQKDLKVQHEFECRGLTYWFDGKRKTAFCLIEAPDKNAIVEMHNKAHGQVPHSIIEVEASIVESFLGRIEDPKRAQDTGLNIINDPAFRIIMVVSLNRLSLTKKDSALYKTTFGKFTGGIRKILKKYNGNIVKQTDHYYLSSFNSITKSVHAASDIQDINREFDKQNSKEKLNLKIGLNAGVPVTKKQLLFEDTVKLAERMCDIVKGEIVVSAEVKELYKSENVNTFIKGKGIISISPTDEKFITLLMDYIDAARTDANLKVDNFSKPLGCSKSQFYRKMISLTGKSPNAFIQEYRLNEALKLLSKKAGNVSEIAFQAGFSSPSYFSKCFKKKFGLLPAAYLNSLQ